MTRGSRTGSLLVAGAALAIAAGAGQAADGTVSPQELVWRTQNRCGINSMYLFLRLHGADVSYQTVEERLPVGENGSTLAEMRAAARSCGVRAQVLKLGASELESVRVPFVAHTEEVVGSGHFVVVTATGRDREGNECVEIIDGTTGIPATLSVAEFRRRWSGYVLAEAGAWWAAPLPRAAGLLLVSLSGLVALWFTLKQRPAGGRTPPLSEPPA